MHLLIALSVGIFSILTVSFAVMVAGRGKKLPEGANVPSAEEMRQHILWKSFYINPQDPRGWVPKLSGLGWTVNFRTKANALVFLGLVLLTLTSALTHILTLLF